MITTTSDLLPNNNSDQRFIHQQTSNQTKQRHRLQLTSHTKMSQISALVAEIRETCIRRGVRGILGMATVFRHMDSDFSHTVQFGEFVAGLKAYGVNISHEDLRRVFDSFDKDRSGSIDFREFVNALRPPLAPCRVKLINVVFDKLDHNKDGVLKTEDLRVTYKKNAEQHPDYIRGVKNLEQVLTLFLQHFDDPESPDGSVTREEFLDYYSGVSATIDDNCYFDLMMRTCWDLPSQGMPDPR